MSTGKQYIIFVGQNVVTKSLDIARRKMSEIVEMFSTSFLYIRQCYALNKFSNKLLVIISNDKKQPLALVVSLPGKRVI